MRPLRLAAWLMLLPVLGTAVAGSASVPEKYRPHFHFTTARNWLNDPNGLIYWKGEYHLFFQHNPFGDTWGHMSWGHAVSPDLLRWKELPVAIPEDDQEMIFSGSVVADERNSSGFGRDGRVPLVAIYTSAGRGDGALQRQSLAYSLDDGRTWTKYAGNPVLDIGASAFRDPKVFWHMPSRTWIMVVSMADRHRVAFYSSTDLKRWTHVSDFGPAGAVDGPWECPDLFELPVDGDASNSRWVLKVDVFRSAVAQGSGAQYFVGRFDGMRFTPEPDPTQPAIAAPVQWVDGGMDFYAALSWQHLPTDPPRRVWIAWMNSHHYAQEIPTAPFRGAMSLPRELTLHRQGGSLRLRQAPVREMAALRGRPMRTGTIALGDRPVRVATPRNADQALELVAVLEPGSSREAGLKLRVGANQETLLAYDAATRSLVIDRSRSGAIPAPIFSQRRSLPVRQMEGRLRLQVFVDASSMEVFANDGESVMTEQIFAAPGSTGVEAYARGGVARLISLEAWPLRRSVIHAR